MTFDINLAEYDDPELYDLENQDFEPDGPFILGFARRFGGPVLELGCGTGRVTIPLARQGIDITGLDVAPAMLRRAREKASGCHITWVEADARSFHLAGRFRLIFETGSVFMHLLERRDQEAYLKRVREHLAAGGRFLFGVMFPHPDLLVSEEAEKEWFTYENEAGQEVRVSGREVYDPIRQVKLETAYRRWIDADGRQVERVAPLSLRYIFPQEIESLLHYNGLEILERYGGPDGSSLTASSRLMIYLCGSSSNGDC